VLLLNNDDIAKVLTIEATIEALEAAYLSYASGTAICRPRIDIRVASADAGETYQWGTMEGASEDSGYFAIRMKSDVTYFTEYEGVRTHEKYAGEPGLFCGLILLTSTKTAEPLALMNDGVLQHLRVGADGGIGAKYAARENAEIVGMLGSGGMARSHIEALLAVRPIKKVVVFSPTAAHREEYAEEVRARHGIEALAVDDPQEVHAAADILCGCTDAVGPVIRGEWIHPGTHVSTVGGALDQAALDKVDAWFRFGNAPSPLGYDDWKTLNETLTFATEPGASGRIDGHAKTIPPRARRVSFSDVVRHQAKIRESDNEITFSERGNLQGLQFFSVGGAAYEAAIARGVGHELPREWFLQDIRD
jgi:ornithine cyclodeaminase/alanine dehydrogenase-like protein (mu-crystallin family)